MHLHFHGPYPLCSDDADLLGDCPHAHAAGIYLWAVPSLTSGFVVDYVGQTSTSFYRRTKEHLIQALGGNYLILDAKRLAELRVHAIWLGLWRRGTRHEFPRFLSQYEELAPRIKEYLILHRVFLAPLVADRRSRERVEASLAEAFRATTPRLLPDDIRFHPRRASEPALQVRVSSDRPIAGLPVAFDA